MNFQKALVTGASSGIGEGFARYLAKGGTNVTLVARREERLSELCDELSQAFGVEATYVVADLSHDEDSIRVAELIAAGSFDLLVSNAGRGSFNHFDQLEIEDEIAMMRLNALAPMRLYHAALRSMKSRGHENAAILSVSSIAGFQPLPLMATYAATKAVNYSHGLALHFEAKRLGIRFLTICPGPVATEFAGVARVPGEFTGLPREPVSTVVEDSFAALRKGKPIVIPGLRAKLLSAPSRVLPLVFSTWVSGQVLARTLRKSAKS